MVGWLVTGHTQHSRSVVFALRPAPVQVVFLGFPGSTGAQFMDFIVTDRVASPLRHAELYTEKLAYMVRQPTSNGACKLQHGPLHVTSAVCLLLSAAPFLFRERLRAKLHEVCVLGRIAHGA